MDERDWNEAYRKGQYEKRRLNKELKYLEGYVEGISFVLNNYDINNEDKFFQIIEVKEDRIKAIKVRLLKLPGR